MNDEEAIKQLNQWLSVMDLKKKISIIPNRDDIQAIEVVLKLIEKQQAEIEKKDNIQKEVAEEINNVAVELSKLTDNIFIVNQAMKLQKIAEEKLGKFYID